MKKFTKTLVLIVVAICVAFTIAACGGGKADFSYGEDYETNGITLGRYEELDLLPIEGSADGIKITSADTSIVSVVGNRLIAESEGQTTITAERKSTKKKIRVRVYDDGARLNIGTEQDVVYIGHETDLGFHVVYSGKNYAYDADYKLTIPSAYSSFAEVRDGKIYGLAEGTITVKATLEDYKGEEVRGEFKTIRVCPASFVDVEAKEVSVYNAKDSKHAKATIKHTVHYNAQKLEDADVVYEVSDGSDKIDIDADGNITAKAEGTATVKVKYASDESVFAEVRVTVLPNYVASSFSASNVGSDEHKQTYAAYEGTEEIGGRKEGIFEYTQGDGSDWDSRMTYAEAGDSIVTNARKGYKYFAYDLYLGGSQIYIGLDHADCQWLGAGAYIRSDYMQIVDCETGVITNRLERNKWIKIVYNLDYYLNNSSYVAFAETGFFYTQSGTVGSHSYIDNVRWYLDDEYYDHDAEGNIKYTLNADGTISATNNEWTFDNTVVRSTYKDTASNKTYYGDFFTTEATYAPAEGEIAGVTGAWKFAPVNKTFNSTVTVNGEEKTATAKFGSWENQLKLVSATAYKNGSTGDKGYNVNGMRNLTEGIAQKVGAPVNDSVESKYKFLTFDLYVDQGSSFSLNLNHVDIGGKIKLGVTKDGYVDGGTDLSTKSSYLRVWEKGSDKLAYYMESGKWYTLCLAYFDNYNPDGWSANILFAGDGGNVYYLNDVKFHKSMDGVAPTEYAGYKPTSGLTMLDNTKAQGGTLAWVYDAEVEEKGEEFKGALKFTTTATSNAWENSRLGFDQIAVGSSFFKEGKNYAVVDVYFDENVKSLGAYTWATYSPEGLTGKIYSKSLKLGETTEMYLYEDGSRVKGNVEANKWYTLVIPVDYPAKQQWAVGSVEVLSKDGTAATTYFNNIRYTKDLPYECKDIVITDKPESVAWKSMSGANTADTKDYAISYFVTPGYDIEWTSNNAEVATVSNGIVTFNRGKWNQSVTITATITIADGVTVSDSVTFTLTNNVTEFKAGSSVTLAYGDDEEAETIFATTTATNAAWNNTFSFNDIVNGSSPIESFRASGNKYAVVDVKFDSNVKQFLITMWLNTGSSPTYQKYVTIGSPADAATYFYDMNGARVTGNIEADTWYKLFIPTDYTNANRNWAQAYLGMNAKTEANATMQIKNLTYVKAITGVYDPVEITGAPSGDLIWETVNNTYITLGKNSPLDVTWRIEKVSGDDGVVTIDSATGKVTITAKASDTEVKSGLYKVTATPTEEKFASLASSVNISIISEYDEPTTWHFASSASVWQGNTGDQFAKSWKVTGSDVLIAGANSGPDKADYIIFDLYLSKSKGFTYHSSMWDKDRLGRAWVWGTSSRQLVVKEKDWVTTNSTTDRYVKVYDMDGNAVANVTNGVWYKVILPFNKSGRDVGWGDCRLILEADNGEKELYYRNVSYGNTLPSDLYDLKITGAPSTDVYLAVGSHQLGVETNAGAVEWTSSSDEIASVDQTGKVTFHKAGNVTITVTPTGSKRAPLAKSVTLSIKEESVTITDTRTAVEWRSLPETKQITIETSYTPTLTLNWTVADDCADYATVDENGVVTFLEAGRYHDVTINVSTENSAGVELTDSITIALNDTVNTHISAGSGATLKYSSAADTNEVVATTTSSGSINLIDIVVGTSPVSAWRNNGYNYFVADVYFDSNVKKLNSKIWLNKGSTWGTSYQDGSIEVGAAVPTSQFTLYDAETKARTFGNVETGKWYTIFLKTDYSNYHTWAQAYLTLVANDGTTATAKFKNITAAKDLTGVYDVIEITGAPSKDLLWENDNGTEIVLGKNSSLDVTWSIEKVSGDDGMASIDASTGKVTIAAKASETEVKSGLYKVTATPTDSRYENLASSVNISIISEYDEPTTWHLYQKSNVEWQGNTDNEFAKSWKFTGGDLVIGGKASEYTGDSKSVATANYITLEIYFAKASGVNYFSNMYTNGSDGKGKVAFAWLWNNTASKNVTVYQSDWKTVVSATENYVRFYEMDGSASTKVETGKWYKLVLPKNIESDGITWGQIRLSIDGVKNGEVTEREVYYRNVSYGDTIPSGWINA